ncbi:hypothetical protein VNO78_26933 [Psophocarpus tetragonolobus]|uniref:Uncharacterized protein n=1 Tax=Psophocarpus tetragonolobus TaxID=3891 RepID=A0AAN9S0S9_PSOTE
MGCGDPKDRCYYSLGVEEKKNLIAFFTCVKNKPCSSTSKCLSVRRLSSPWDVDSYVKGKQIVKDTKIDSSDSWSSNEGTLVSETAVRQDVDSEVREIAPLLVVPITAETTIDLISLQEPD